MDLPIGLHGQLYDTSTGLSYMRARYYSPDSGRFLSADPIEGTHGIPQSHHDYVFAWNDPVNQSDTTGLSPLTEQLATLSIVQKTLASAAVIQALVGVALRKVFGTLEWSGPTASVGLGDFSIGLASFASQEYEGTVGLVDVLTISESVINGANSLASASSQNLAVAKSNKYANRSSNKGTAFRHESNRRLKREASVANQDLFNINTLVSASFGDARVFSPLLYTTSAASFSGFYLAGSFSGFASGFSSGNSGASAALNFNKGVAFVSYGFAAGYTWNDSGLSSSNVQKTGRGFVDLGYSYSIDVGISIGIGSYQF
jgi:RHS repeat-associated protein